jgi:hypothetical protein
MKNICMLDLIVYFCALVSFHSQVLSNSPVVVHPLGFMVTIPAIAPCFG